MSINTTHFGADLVCDACGEEADEIFDDFFDAVEYKKKRSNGWKSKNIDGEWEDHCPSCNNKGGK